MVGFDLFFSKLDFKLLKFYIVLQLLYTEVGCSIAVIYILEMD